MATTTPAPPTKHRDWRMNSTRALALQRLPQPPSRDLRGTSTQYSPARFQDGVSIVKEAPLSHPLRNGFKHRCRQPASPRAGTILEIRYDAGTNSRVAH